MSVKEFKLPDLGEGLPDGEIIRWTVKVGDTVKVNDIIAEVETVKAAVELPSPFAGMVTALLAEEGDTVPVGNAIIAIETAGFGGRSVVLSMAVISKRPLVGYGAQENVVAAPPPKWCWSRHFPATGGCHQRYEASSNRRKSARPREAADPQACQGTRRRLGHRSRHRPAGHRHPRRHRTSGQLWHDWAAKSAQW